MVCPGGVVCCLGLSGDGGNGLAAPRAIVRLPKLPRLARPGGPSPTQAAATRLPKQAGRQWQSGGAPARPRPPLPALPRCVAGPPTRPARPSRQVLLTKGHQREVAFSSRTYALVEYKSEEEAARWAGGLAPLLAGPPRRGPALPCAWP